MTEETPKREPFFMRDTAQAWLGGFVQGACLPLYIAVINAFLEWRP